MRTCSYSIVINIGQLTISAHLYTSLHNAADPVTRRCRGSRWAADGRGRRCVAATPSLAFPGNVQDDDNIVILYYGRTEERQETEFSLPTTNTTRTDRHPHGRADRSRMRLEQISRGRGGG
ncbi:hypothetical protein QTP88_004588 [Uroleucon formosanum]